MSEKIWNPMRKIRQALDLPMTDEGIHEFLDYWMTLTHDEKVQLRTMDLNTLKDNPWNTPPQQEINT